MLLESMEELMQIEDNIANDVPLLNDRFFSSPIKHDIEATYNE